LSKDEFIKVIKIIVPQAPEYILPEFKQIIFDSPEDKPIDRENFINTVEEILNEKDED